MSPYHSELDKKDGFNAHPQSHYICFISTYMPMMQKFPHYQLNDSVLY